MVSSGLIKDQNHPRGCTLTLRDLGFGI